MVRIGVITGVQREAEILVRSPIASSLDIRVGGAAHDRTAKLCSDLTDAGVEGLVSFGTCAGLSPLLSPGALVVPEIVHAPNGPSLAVDDTWRRSVLRAVTVELPGPQALLGSDSLVSSAREKARLGADSDAVCLDMESHIVARHAQRAGLPFLAVRAVADPAARAVPTWALDGIAPDGATRALPIIVNVLKRPGRIPVLYRLWRDNAAAEAALGRVAGSVPAGFGFGGVGGDL